MLQLTNFLRLWLLPPGFCWVLLLVGIGLLRRRPRASKALLLSGLVSGYLCSLSWFSGWLANWWESGCPPIPPDGLAGYGCQAIVVLGGGGKDIAFEYGRADVNQPSLVRARYGAFVQHQTGLPLLFTGVSEVCPEAEVQAQVAREMGCPPKSVWTELESRTTLESAVNCAKLLESRQIRKVFLVTQAFHMPRASKTFRRSGLDIVPAPTDVPGTKSDYDSPPFWICPSASALLGTSTIMQEMLGTAFYTLKAGT